ncbi:MAG: hypothetical protein KKG76_11455 [Euryarchaeota archaeon]|nr:hypothetical protein [Euryarchaeota archaeon]
MKKIKLTKLTLPNDEIIKLDKKEKKRYIMFTCMVRDLNLLQKCLAFISNEKPTNDPYISANTTISFFFLKTLISKIHEMWFFMNNNKIWDDYSNFSSGLKNIGNEVKKFFSDKKVEDIFSFIRNKFGFHYEYWDDVDKLIDDASKSFPQFEMYLSSENSANEIFSSSNAVILKVIFLKMQELGFEGEDKDLMDILFNLALQGARLFQEFSVFYLSEAFSIKWEQQEEIEVEAPLVSEVRLPLIVAR